MANDIGYILFANNDNYIWVDYLAVFEKYRSMGFGSKILDLIKKEFKNYNGIFFEVEKVDENKIIKKIPNRKNLLRCKTPQGIISGLIKKAHKIALEKKLNVTDDAGIIVNLGLGDVFVVEGEIESIKVTYKDDIIKAKEKLR